VEYTKGLLEEIGLEPERLEMFPIGASDAPAWVRAVTEMTGRARKLGPNPLKKS
jgi:F420-non-reducing hydrogenase iron-sulfur subunit